VKKNGSVTRALGRRHTLHVLGAGLAAGGLFALGGCKQNQGSSGGEGQGSTAKAQDCNTPLDEQAKSQRRTLQYVDKAAVPEKNCAACAQYVAAQYGACGGCKVLPGPVRPEGGCLAFAPKTAAPAATP
jgi:hypothetical protein